MPVVPSENAGLQVNRGSSSDVFLQWNEIRRMAIYK